MNKFNFNVSISYSKIMALLVLIAGSVFSYINNDSSVLLTTISTVTVMIGFKQYTDKNK